MKQLSNVLVLLISTLFILSCGGSGGGLSTDQVNAVSAALTGTMNATSYNATIPSSININSIASIDSATFTHNSDYSKFTANLNDVYACSGGGHITYVGNVILACAVACTYPPEPAQQICECGTWYSTTVITFHVSDPTNNLNDCDVGGGVILDGTINFMASGTLPAINASMNGTISVNKRGDTGGLVPIADDCLIALSFPYQAKATGTICGNSVSN